MKDQEDADDQQYGNKEGHGVEKKQSILDGLTQHRAERCHILLRNLPNEDLVHIEKEKIPAFLRIDADILTKTKMLKEFHQSYMNFNIESLDRDVRNRLKQNIAQASEDYSLHKDQVNNLLKQGDESNRISLAKQNETVSMRQQQNRNITEALKESHQRLRQFESQNAKKDSLRKELEQKLSKLREMEVNIEQEAVKNGNLKKVVETETDLKKFRDKKESELLNIANKTQVDSATWINGNLKTVNTEDDKIRKETQALKDKMEHRKTTIVQQLLAEIEQDRKQNQLEV